LPLVEVRGAGRGDLVAIGQLAESAHWEAYSGLLDPVTISALLRRDFSPGALRRRLLTGGVVVAEESGHLVGFAEGVVEGDRLRLTALAAHPGSRRSGVAGRLLAALRARAPDLPVSADVMLGCLPVEGYLEARGFAPGEILQTTLFSEQVVERRWWLPPG
jgi:N-acetylglutamate synthase-like GNAT family acetyltransferase